MSKQQSNKQFDTIEAVMLENIMEPLSMGLGLDFIRGVQHLFFKSVASCVTVFFRYRLGTRTLTGITLFWGLMAMILFWAMNYAGSMLSSGQATGHFWIHGLLFLLVGNLHIWSARRNLRRRDGKGELRHGDENGLSWLWPLFAKVLAPFGLIYDGKGLPQWYQFTEYSFQKWVEPILAILVGLLFINAGHGMYGALLVAAGVSMKLLCQMAENQFYKAKQDTWDAEIASGLLNGAEQGQPEPAGMVMQKTLLRRSEKDFQKWRKQKRTEAVFATAEHRTDYRNSPAG